MQAPVRRMTKLIRTERFGTIPNPGHRVKTSNQADATNQPSHDLPAAEQRRSERQGRSEEHTSELQSLMRISYAVFCLKKKNTKTKKKQTQIKTYTKQKT